MNTALALTVQHVADENHDWRDGAPCGTVDPDIFFDLAEQDAGIAEMAKSMCKVCPIRKLCLDKAMLGDEPYGIWGGMDAAERKSHSYLWRRIKGGKGAVRALREGDGILIHDPGIDRRYGDRLRAAVAARNEITAGADFLRRDEVLQVLEMIVSNPTADSGRLAARLGRSTAWFNGLKRLGYSRCGISENDWRTNEGGDAA